MAAKGIGHNPTLTNTYQTNNQNSLYETDRNYNYNYYDDAQPYNENLTNENYGKSLAASVGHFDVNKLMNRRLPSHLSHDMGASNYQAPVGNYQGTQFDPSQGNMPYNPVEKTGILQSIKNKGMKFMTPLMAMANKFNPLSPTSSNFNPMLEGQLENYKAQGFRVNEQGQAIDGPLAGQNMVSGFGTNDVTQQLRNRLAKLRSYDYKSEIKAKKEKDILDAIKAQTIAENKGYSGTPRGNTGSGAFARFDNTTKDYGPHSKGGGNQGNSGSGVAPGTGASGPPGRNYKAYGGRIGFRNGEFIDENINVEGPNFDVNENIEMAETSPFEMRIQELMDTGMSWQEAYQIASQEFGQVVEGESDQGIASLV